MEVLDDAWRGQVKILILRFCLFLVVTQGFVIRTLYHYIMPKLAELLEEWLALNVLLPYLLAKEINGKDACTFSSSQMT